MNRRTLLESSGSAALLLLVPQKLRAKSPDVPWARLQRALDGKLLRVHSALLECRNAPSETQCGQLFANLRNPYFIGDDPALTQTLGWADAWTSAPSTYAVAAQHAGDIAQAVNFAREYGVRLAVKGGGHSYLGTSNAPDSLLVWTRRMRDIAVEGDSVRIDAGCVWRDAYDAVTTQHGRYVQGGGCTTVGVAGLVQSGGFGSFSKRFGTAAASLLEAQVVTADGKIRTVNGTADPDLLWALKGGGGGTFGVVSRMTLALHDLPPYFGAAVASVSAASDDAYRRLVRRFVSHYSEALFNQHWGESVSFGTRNVLDINMVAQGLDTEQISAVWKPFFDWVKASPSNYTLRHEPILAAAPARGWWDVAFWNKNMPDAIRLDPRPGRGTDWWWGGDSGQAGWFLYGFESLWMPADLLKEHSQEELSTALFSASRRFSFALHFNKGLAGAPPLVIAAAANTAMNPNVLTSFALAISADGDQGYYPGIRDHEPDLTAARAQARAIHDCINELRAVAPAGGPYVSESSYFERSWQTSYWGNNYSRLAAVKKRYDPQGLFAVHHSAGSPAI